MKKKIVCLLLLTGLLLTLGGCKDEKEKLESSKEEKATVMRINGFDVPYELYRYVALNYKDQYESRKDDGEDIWLGEAGQELLNELNGHVNETLARMYTTIILCEEYDIHLDDQMILDSVDAQMDVIYEGYENDYKLYADDMEKNHMTDSVYRFIVRNDILTEELFNTMIEQGEIRVDTEELADLFESDSFIRVKQILISADNGNSEEENYAKAEELHQRAVNGENFEELVQTYGQDLFMFNNDDGYYMMRGSYYPAFEEAAFALEIGEISDIVESEAGYSIIKRYEKDPDYLADESNFESLCQTYFDSVYNTKLEARLESVTVEPTELYDDYTIFTMK